MGSVEGSLESRVGRLGVREAGKRLGQGPSRRDEAGAGMEARRT